MLNFFKKITKIYFSPIKRAGFTEHTSEWEKLEKKVQERKQKTQNAKKAWEEQQKQLIKKTHKDKEELIGAELLENSQDALNKENSLDPKTEQEQINDEYENEEGSTSSQNS